MYCTAFHLLIPHFALNELLALQLLLAFEFDQTSICDNGCEIKHFYWFLLPIMLFVRVFEGQIVDFGRNTQHIVVFRRLPKVFNFILSGVKEVLSLCNFLVIRSFLFLELYRFPHSLNDF